MLCLSVFAIAFWDAGREMRRDEEARRQGHAE
jgi:hypothetical protein